MLLVGSALSWSTASAQLPTPLPKPNVNLLTSGDVYAIARLADGSAVIGGRFVSVNGVLRSNIAKRLPDGTLDPNWHPAIDGDIRTLAVDGDGNVYVGGEFTHAAGYARSNLAKLSPNGTVVPAWDPSPDGVVHAIVLNAAGDAFVGGEFANIGGQARSRLAKISASIGTSPNNTVTDIAVASNGSVFVAGDFVQFGYNSNLTLYRSNVAKLSGTGNGNPIAAWDPLPYTSYTSRVALSDDGWVYLSGGLTYFSEPGFVPQAIRRAAADGTGAIDMSWQPGVNGDVYAVSASADKVYAGGYVVDVAGQTRLGFVVLNGNGTVAGPALDAENPTGGVLAMAKQTDRKLIVAGFFEKANGQLREGLLRLNTDGSLDTNWNPSSDGYVRAIAIGSDGSIFVGGSFSRMGGQQMRGVAKLDSSTGAADGGWNPGFRYATIYGLAFDNAGYVYVGGDFGDSATTSRNLVRIPASGNGAVDLSWLPAPYGKVTSLSLDGNGALFVSGSFVNIADEPRSKLAKLYTNGPTLLDSAWLPNNGSNAGVSTVLADGLGSVYVVGGSFQNPGDGGPIGVAKLSASGSGAMDPLWNPGFVDVVVRIALDVPHSSLFAETSTYDGTTGISSYFLSKHSTTHGALESNWRPTINDGVSTMLVDGDKLLLGGYFTQVSGQQRYGLAALPLSVPDRIHADGFDTSP